jgi:phosphoribosylaminoimidazole-succinocarboxamide synthase
VGSVKDLYFLIGSRERRINTGRFIFSDRYSVFDWGELPDHIENKGAALCLMGAYCFEKAEEQGIRTHYRGLVRSDGKLVRLDDIEEPTNTMEVSLVGVIHPKFENGSYYYSMFTPELTNFLIPLEIIYRNGLPESSSIFKRLKKGEINLDDLGLDHYPNPGEGLEKPIFDVSTKLEERDRYITWREAKEIANLSDSEAKEIKDLLFRTNELITQIAGKTNLVNEDGKIELAFDPNRKLMLVDVIGTLDECRFTYRGFHVSKEIARQYYKNTDWYKDVEEAKKKAEEQKIREWRNLCKSQPGKLHPELKGIIENMYTSTANAFLGKNLFDSPKLEDVVKNYEEFINLIC